MKKQFINEICQTLKELHKAYPAQNLGRHLDAAFADYTSLFGLSDRELLFALQKYQTTLEIDPIASEAEVDKLLRDTDRLFTSGFDSLDDEEEDDF